MEELDEARKEREEDRREREQLREALLALSAPKRLRPKAPRHEATPKIVDLVRKRGYATCRDAELLGLGNTDWQRCLADIRLKEPDLRVSVIKHTKFLYRPDFDLKNVEASAFTIGNCTATEPRLMNLLVRKVLRLGRANVLRYLQDEAPGRSDAWREEVLNALSSYARVNKVGIEREPNALGRPGDWFRKRA
jgi:hypothetical protein